MHWYLTLSGFINVYSNVYWYLQQMTISNPIVKIVVTLHSLEITKFPKKSITCDDSRLFVYLVLLKNEKLTFQ